METAKIEISVNPATAAKIISEAVEAKGDTLNDLVVSKFAEYKANAQQWSAEHQDATGEEVAIAVQTMMVEAITKAVLGAFGEGVNSGIVAALDIVEARFAEATGRMPGVVN